VSFALRVVIQLSSIGFNDYSGALNIRLKVWSVACYATSEEDKTTLLIDSLYNQLKCVVQLEFGINSGVKIKIKSSSVVRVELSVLKKHSALASVVVSG
jgi:hypothetical protein